MRVGIDIDGVCYNFTKALSEYIQWTTGKVYPQVPTCWEFYEVDWGMSLVKYLDFFREGVEANYIFIVGTPVYPAVEALHALRKAGHTIVLNTDRSIGWNAKISTMEWIANYDIPYDEMVFLHDKSYLNVDVAIDDRPKNVDAIRNSGIEAYCMGFDNRIDMQEHDCYLDGGWEQFLGLLEIRTW